MAIKKSLEIILDRLNEEKGYIECNIRDCISSLESLERNLAIAERNIEALKEIEKFVALKVIK